MSERAISCYAQDSLQRMSAATVRGPFSPVCGSVAMTWSPTTTSRIGFWLPSPPSYQWRHRKHVRQYQLRADDDIPPSEREPAVIPASVDRSIGYTQQHVTVKLLLILYGNPGNPERITDTIIDVAVIAHRPNTARLDLTRQDLTVLANILLTKSVPVADLFQPI